MDKREHSLERNHLLPLNHNVLLQLIAYFRNIIKILKNIFQIEYCKTGAGVSI